MLIMCGVSFLKNNNNVCSNTKKSGLILVNSIDFIGLQKLQSIYREQHGNYIY